MKKTCLFFLCAVLVHAADGFHLKDGDHVVFYGDSITDQRLYTVITESYVATRYPKLNVKWTHSGWGGDKVSGGGGGPVDVRLDRDVIAYKPTVVTIMLGMNDGLYRKETAENDKVYEDGYRHIVEKLHSALPGVRITAIQPSPYDDVTRPPTFPGGYNEVLLSFSNWIANYAEAQKLTVADLNTEVVAMLKRANELEPARAATIIPDRVHPRFSGHLSMAEQLLKSWNARPVVSTTVIDAASANAKARTTEHTAISELSGNSDGISWTAVDDALPLPFSQWEQNDNSAIDLMYRSSDVADALNNQTLTVRGLKRGSYALAIDGQTAGTFNNAQWARGVNIATLDTPMTRQAKQVFDLTVEHCDIHNSRWRNVQVPLEKMGIGGDESVISAMDSLEENVIRKRNEAAQPKPHKFELKALGS